MSDQNTNSSVEMDLTSDEEDKLLESNMTNDERTGLDESILEAEDINENQILNSPISNSDSEYYIYHPPRYALPPYQSPISSVLNVIDQIKLICSYHTFISRSIANQANTQLDTCGYPEPIDVIEGTNNFTEDSTANNNGNDNSEEYVSRSGRITKRKYYFDADPFVDNISTHEESNKDEPTKKKATLTTIGNENDRESLVKSVGNVTEGMINPSSTLGLIEQEILDSDICIRPSPVQTITHDINCPICALYYPGKYVERHAASCQDIVKNGHDCNYCGGVLRTLDEYEIHITECTARSAFFV